MGDPKKQRKKYDTPQHPWEGRRIEEERGLKLEYGLKNKKEIWKASTLLRKIKEQARRLISAETEQAKKEEKQLIEKLVKLNLVGEDAKVDDILGIDLKKLLDRRLQTCVFKKNLAKSIKQARQFISHKHIMVKDHTVNIPSYLVKKDEENKVCFNPVSNLSKSDHPERAPPEKKAKSKEVRLLRKPVEKVKKTKVVKKTKDKKKGEKE